MNNEEIIIKDDITEKGNAKDKLLCHRKRYIALLQGSVCLRDTF